MITDPAAPVLVQPADRDHIPSISPDLERAVASVRPNGTKKCASACIHELFEAQAARTPDHLALVCGAGSRTYRELNERSNRLARYVRGLGVGPEALVGICVERSIETVVGVLAILKAGGAYVPLDPSYPVSRLNFI